MKYQQGIYKTNNLKTILMKNKKYVLPVLLALFLLLNWQTLLSASENVSKNNKPSQSKEVMPSFPGGEESMHAYIRNNTILPEEVLNLGVKGNVKVRFCVSATGDVIDVQIKEGFLPSCDAEAKRLVQAMPKWIPGSINGKNVPVYFNLPIRFSMSKDANVLKNVIYIFNGKEISPQDMNTKIQENAPSLGEAVTTNSFMFEGRDMSKYYGDKYKGKMVLKMVFPDLMDGSAKSHLSHKEPIVNIPDIQPSFPKGDEELKKYLKRKAKYPKLTKENNAKGVVVIEIIVRKTGEVDFSDIVEGVDILCNAEAVRIVEQMPKWIPGELNGEKVNCVHRISIPFGV